MKTKVKNTLLIIAAIAAGYVAGAFIGLPQTSGNLGSGDISKVSKFHKESAGVQHSAYEEKLLADSEAMQNEVVSTGVLAQKLVEFSDLVDLSVEVAGDIEELGEYVNALKDLQELSDNAAQTAFTAVDALENLGKGNNDLGITYEQASQNLMVAYMMVDNQARVGKEFAIAADGYYANHSNLTKLADIRDKWAQFCCECAMLKGSEDSEQQYWASNTDAKLSDLSSIKVLSRNNTLNKAAEITAIARNEQSVKRADVAISRNEQSVKRADVAISRNEQSVKRADVAISRNEQAVRRTDAAISRNEAFVSRMDATSIKMLFVVSKNETSLSRTASALRRTDIAAQRAAVGSHEALSRNEQAVKRTSNMAAKQNNGQK